MGIWNLVRCDYLLYLLCLFLALGDIKMAGKSNKGKNRKGPQQSAPNPLPPTELPVPSEAPLNDVSSAPDAPLNNVSSVPEANGDTNLNESVETKPEVKEQDNAAEQQQAKQGTNSVLFLD